MEYNVDYFIDKFEAIPEEKWCKWQFYNERGQSCANGHCGVILRSTLYLTDESKALKRIMAVLDITDKDMLEYHKAGKYLAIKATLADAPFIEYSDKAAFINNGDSTEYQQDTPKQRILAALYDIKGMQAVKEVENILEEQLEVVN